MPVIAFCAWLWTPNVCKSATAKAIQAGFRFIWSSVAVGTACQKAQGEAIKASGVDRSEFFVAGTVDSRRCRGYDDCYKKTARLATQQFEILDTNLDMLMLDYPSSSGCDGIQGQCDAFEEIKKKYQVGTISVS